MGIAVQYTSRTKLPILLQYQCHNCRRPVSIETSVIVEGAAGGTVFSNEEKKYDQAHKALAGQLKRTMYNLSNGDYKRLKLRHCKCPNCGKKAEWAVWPSLLKLLPFLAIPALVAAFLMFAAELPVVGIIILAAGLGVAIFSWMTFSKHKALPSHKHPKVLFGQPQKP